MSSLPDKVGRYHVVGLLATGGMAEILLGRTLGPSGFERPVVIKRVLPHLARSQSFVDMFLDEARILASIRHPNVVQVFELGRDGEDLFLAMEFLEGESLGALVRRLRVRERALPHALAAHIVAEACAGLHAAHELTDPQGAPLELVHRDVTPQNIFITYSGQVKVIDFGIAQAARRLAHTEPGHVKGKFAYMSPEQCLGEPLDRRSDIFSLGIVLFEIGTGRRLFKRTNDLLTFKAICQDRYPRPRAVEPSFPTSLEAIVIGALRRNREKRFPTAAAMRRQLRLVERDLLLDDLPSDALAALMRELFAERIEDAQNLVRRVQSGSEITAMPAPEADGDVALPEVEVVPDRDETEWIGDSASEAARSDLAARVPSGALESIIGGPSLDATFGARTFDAVGSGRSRRGTLGLAALAGTLLAAAAAMGWWLGPRAPAEESGELPDPAGSSPLGSRPTSSSVEAGGGPDLALADGGGSGDAGTIELVRLAIRTIPAGAAVAIEGRARGSTPAQLEVDRGSKPLELVLTLDGYLPIVERIVPDTDAKLQYVLRPAPRGTHGGSTPPASSGSGRGFRRFD